eukprot:snap_masked-scaffold_3-processed-gene-2.13-mRNA-1 protein AED:1.00 eAED:1.00 QI:0/0/0/0/1/1/2/0/547
MDEQRTSEANQNTSSEVSPTNHESNSNDTLNQKVNQPRNPKDEGDENPPRMSTRATGFREAGCLGLGSTTAAGTCKTGSRGKHLAEQEASNNKLREILQEQKEANDELQDVLLRRKEKIEEREECLRQREANQNEHASNLPENYEDADENKVLEHLKKQEKTNKLKGDRESAMSYRSLDPWSETESSYLDKNANKKGYRYEYNHHMVTEGRPSGVPLVQFQLPPKLKELIQKAIINFLHNFDGVAINVPNLNIRALLTEDVTSSLRHRGVDVRSSYAIYKYLKKHVSKFDRINRARCLKTLVDELEWPSRSLSPGEQIYLCFDKVNKILRFLSEGEKDQQWKRIIKILLKKVPTSINLELGELMLGAKHLNLPRIKQAFMNNRAGLKTHPKKPTGEPKQEYVKQRKNKHERANRIKLGKIGSSGQDIGLSLLNIHSKEFEQVQGIADTGASRNVASLKLMQNYSINEEDPKYIKEVELLDGKMLPIRKVITAKAKLFQGDTQFNLGTHRFFCVDIPTWTDYIIGKKTLDYFNIKLDLSKADRPKEKK